MAIKNKDGTAFTLRGPNPVLDKQEFWDPNDVVLHNFKWEGVVVASGNDRPVADPVPEPATIAEELFAEESETQAESFPDPDPIPDPIPDPVSQPVERASVFHRKSVGKIRMHCLPAFVAEYRDDLYDQSYRSVQYGEKFIADAGVVSQGDVDATFWSADARITVGSILYPMTMEKRWWEVFDVESRPLGGYFLRCQVSDKQPAFD